MEVCIEDPECASSSLSGRWVLGLTARMLYRVFAVRLYIDAFLNNAICKEKQSRVVK